MEKYDAAKHEHQGWATVDDYGNTVIKEFIEGKLDTEAPILIDQEWIMENLSHLEGKILTLLEAVVPSGQQKGAKDIARGNFADLFSEVVTTTQTLEHVDYMTNLVNSKEAKS